MGQYWELVNIDRDQTSGHLGKLGEVFEDDLQEIPRTLIIPTGFPGLEANSIGSSESTSTRVAAEMIGASATSSLLGQPIEIIGMIFEEIEDFSDALMLAVTHGYIFAAGKRRLGEFLIRNAAPWAGDRLICLGDYADDLPEGLLSLEEETRFRNKFVEDGDDSDEVLPLKKALRRRRCYHASPLRVCVYTLGWQRELSRVDRNLLTE